LVISSICYLLDRRHYQCAAAACVWRVLVHKPRPFGLWSFLDLLASTPEMPLEDGEAASLPLPAGGRPVVEIEVDFGEVG
jgi:hypothetical protein